MKAKAETKSITVGAKITPATRKKLAAIAKRRDRKLSHVINQILTSYVNWNHTAAATKGIWQLNLRLCDKGRT